MNRRIFTLILAVLLIASFFLPLDSHASTSPFDIVKSSYGAGSDIEGILFKYGWMLIPLSGIMLLIGALNNETYFLGRGIWAFLPLIALLYLLIRPVTLLGGRFDIMDMIKGFGVGKWIALAASLALAFVWPKR
ncbi:MAG: hypothetical protein U0U70_02600 [Chitinophagaceae bacterium]